MYYDAHVSWAMELEKIDAGENSIHPVHPGNLPGSRDVVTLFIEIPVVRKFAGKAALLL
jgi:hypothetical protein